MSFRSVIGGLALTALVSGVAGCGDDKTNFTATTSSTDSQKIRIIGRVLNAQTFSPVGATIEICGITSGGVDGTGTFVIDIPNNITSRPEGSNDFTTNFTVRISAPGMATLLGQTTLDNDEGGPPNDAGTRSTSVVDMGTIFLNSGFRQKVLVTKDATPLAGARVGIFNEDGLNFQASALNFLFDIATCFDDQFGTTDANGVVEFGNLDPFRDYAVFVPGQDLNNDGTFDFETEIQDGVSVQGTGGVFALDVDNTDVFAGFVSVTDDSSRDFASLNNIALAALANVTGTAGTILTRNGFDTIGNQATTTADIDFRSGDFVQGRNALNVDVTGFFEDEYVTTSTGEVTLVFRTPVHIVTGAAGREVSFEYYDVMADPTTAATYNRYRLVTGTAEVLSGSLNTIWKFTPSQTIPAYTPYALQAFAHDTNDAGRTGNVNREFFRIPTFGTTSSLDVRLDNYNGTTGVSSTAEAVFFDFDRIVRGTFQLIEETRNGVVTNVSGSDSQSLNGTAIINNVTAAGATDIGNLGATTGIRFRAPTGRSLEDNRTGSANTIRFAIVAEDFEGNDLDTILELPVR